MEVAQEQVKKIGIIGLGNVLMGDDAFGPYLLYVLEAGFEFPANVSLMDLGTPSLDLTNYITDFDALVVIDCVQTGSAPGTLRTYTLAELLKRPLDPRTNAHEPGLKEALLVSEFRGRGPGEVLLVGVQPASSATGVGLSRFVKEAIPGAVAEVLKELERHGATARRRESPAPLRVWWEEEMAEVCG